MRLLHYDDRGELSLTKDLMIQDVPSYAILSHTWGADGDEVAFNDIGTEFARRRAGYAKIQFCGEQARKHGLGHFWVDTCCIDKTNNTELAEAIASMFSWYRNAAKCYVYMSDVSVRNGCVWESAFRTSRWFTRGWTLQELLAPKSVNFYSREGEWLGDKTTLERQIYETTHIPPAAFRGTTPLSDFDVDERMQWASKRETKKTEDQAYCLQGIFGVFIPLIYGEGENALKRLKREIVELSGSVACTKEVTSNSGNMDLMTRPSGKGLFSIPWPRNVHFVGRDQILQGNSIGQSLRTGAVHPTALDISCMAWEVLGKTQTILEYAYRYQKTFSSVLWVRANSYESAVESLLHHRKGDWTN